MGLHGNPALPGAYHLPAQGLGHGLRRLQRPGAAQQHQQQPARRATPRPTYGPLDHVDHSRIVSLGAALLPERALRPRSQLLLQRCVHGSQHLLPGRGHAMPGGTNVPGAASQSGALCCHRLSHPRSRTPTLRAGRDFMDAPTQYGIGRHDAVSGQQAPLRHRLPHQLGQRQPVLQRCPATSTVRWCPPISLPS